MSRTHLVRIGCAPALVLLGAVGCAPRELPIGDQFGDAADGTHLPSPDVESPVRADAGDTIDGPQYEAGPASSSTISFRESPESFAYKNSLRVRLGDLEGDGDLDVVVANWRQPASVWLNDGT